MNELMMKFRACVNVADRSYLFTTYPNCFVGSEAVTAMINSKIASNADEAVKLGQKLVSAGMFSHVTREHTFKNDKYFYRFNSDDKHWVQIGENFWNLRGNFVPVVAGIKIANVGNQMSLVKRSNGKFLVICAVEMAPEAKKELDKMTNNGKNIEAFIAAHPFHTIWIPAFHKLYPDIDYYGCPRHLIKLTDIKWKGDLNLLCTRKLFEPDIQMRIPAGCEFVNPKPPATNHMSAVLVFHALSKTIHVDDTFSFFVNPNWLLRLAGMKPGQLGFHRSKSFALEDPHAFEAWVQKLINEWDFDNICAAHSGNKIGGAKAELQLLLKNSAAEFKIIAAKRAHEKKNNLPIQISEEECKNCQNSQGDECG